MKAIGFDPFSIRLITKRTLLYGQKRSDLIKTPSRITSNDFIHATVKNCFCSKLTTAVTKFSYNK